MNKKLFNKTKKELIYLHTAIFSIIFILFTIVTYKFFYVSIYSDIDKKLNIQYENFTKGFTHNNIRDKPQGDIGVKILARGNIIYLSKDNELIKSYPMDIDTSLIRPFYISKDFDYGISSYEYNDLSFRQLKKDFNGYDIEVIQIVNVQENLLNYLKSILLIFLLIAIVVVFLASRYLTSKSLKPVYESFNNQVLFVQDASHELRTPLSIIFSKIEGILKRPDNTIANEEDNLIIIMKEVRRLRKLVYDLLRLSKEDSIVTINNTKFNIVSMIEDIYNEYIDICEYQNKSLLYKSNLDDEYIYSDKEKLRQIVIILLDNAIKYTTANDTISILLDYDKNKVKISIIDTGIGIKKDEINMIFNRFYRASSHRVSNKEGSGIGLSIASILASNLNTSISVDSTYKEGSTFSISLLKG